MMSQKISSRWHFHIPAYKCQEDSWVHKCWVWEGPPGWAALISSRWRNRCSDRHGLLHCESGAKRGSGEFPGLGLEAVKIWLHPFLSYSKILI